MASQEDVQKFHSKIRWNKPLSELEEGLADESLVNSKDAKNGNFPIHIAAQNGHRQLVEVLVKKGAKYASLQGKRIFGVNLVK